MNHHSVVGTEKRVEWREIREGRREFFIKRTQGTGCDALQKD